MGLVDELSQITDTAAESDDVEELARLQQRCETILANVTNSVANEPDPELREHLAGVQQQAREALMAVKQRAAEVKIERMDPEYEQRRNSRARNQVTKKQEEMDEAKKFLSQGGLGDLLGGLLGAVSGGRARPGMPAPGVRTCAECGAELKPNAKFCAECGATAEPKERRCAACGTVLGGTVKFCPDCGARQP